MARHVFFSFHYQRDIFRVNQIRNLPEIIDEAAAGFRDSSLWEEARRKSDDAVKSLIDKGLAGTSVTWHPSSSGCAIVQEQRDRRAHPACLDHELR
jgi:hypothetical protein